MHCHTKKQKKPIKVILKKITDSLNIVQCALYLLQLKSVKFTTLPYLK